MAKSKLIGSDEHPDRNLVFECPGCGFEHCPPVKGEGAWGWNGSVDSPTLSPSILVNGFDPEQRCHSYLENGMILFLPDCFHALAGKTVELPELRDVW